LTLASDLAGYVREDVHDSRRNVMDGPGEVSPDDRAAILQPNGETAMPQPTGVNP
jgi:hypothetical protein